jgi:hypothetical protein
MMRFEGGKADWNSEELLRPIFYLAFGLENVE